MHGVNANGRGPSMTPTWLIVPSCDYDGPVDLASFPDVLAYDMVGYFRLTFKTLLRFLSLPLNLNPGRKQVRAPVFIQTLPHNLICNLIAPTVYDRHGNVINKECAFLATGRAICPTLPLLSATLKRALEDFRAGDERKRDHFFLPLVQVQARNEHLDSR